METEALYAPAKPAKPKRKPGGIERPIKNLKLTDELVVANPGKLVLVQQCENAIWAYATEDPLKHIELIGYFDSCIGNGIKASHRIDVMSAATEPPTYATLAVTEIKTPSEPDRVVTRTLRAE